MNKLDSDYIELQHLDDIQTLTELTNIKESIFEE